MDVSNQNIMGFLNYCSVRVWLVHTRMGASMVKIFHTPEILYGYFCTP